MGMPLDPWQDGAARLALAKREDGLYAAGIGGVILSIPRQVGKTYLIATNRFCAVHSFPELNCDLDGSPDQDSQRDVQEDAGHVSQAEDRPVHRERAGD